MSKSAKKFYASATRIRTRRVPSVPRIPYEPQAIRESNSFGPLIQKYDEYIELFDEGSDESEISSSRRKSHSQEIIAKSRKAVVNNIQEVKSPSKPIIHCYTSKDDVSNPVTTRKSAPVKKISFVLPDGKKPLDEEQMDWKDYHRLEVIYNFMDDLEANYPSICTTASIGKSVEGRHLKILKISNSHASNVAVWMDSGIHAREWIAPAVSTYIADHISRKFESLPDCMTNKDWYFLPVVNPDGYHYSHTSDRLWRKSRSSHNGERFGVDLNRNFSVGWGGKGSSDKPSNAFYRGPYPFSEPESAAMRDVFLNSGIKFKVYITLHSYGQIIIFPYSCTTEMAPDYVQLLEGATAMSKAIYKTNGETYKVGISRDVMYASAGTSCDFAHAAAGIPFCYLIELRSKAHRFKLPKEEIEDTGKEILNSVIALMEFIDTYKYQKTNDNKINMQLKKNESVLDDCVFLRSANSYYKKFESYNKSNYSCAQYRNSKNYGSYVKLSPATVEKDDFCDDTNDAGWPDTFNRNDTYLIQNDPVVMRNKTSEKHTDPYKAYKEEKTKHTNQDSHKKHKENSKHTNQDSNKKYKEVSKLTNNRPMGKISLINDETYAKKFKSYKNAYIETDSSTLETESLTSIRNGVRFLSNNNRQHNNKSQKNRSNKLRAGASGR